MGAVYRVSNANLSNSKNNPRMIFQYFIFSLSWALRLPNTLSKLIRGFQLLSLLIKNVPNVCIASPPCQFFLTLPIPFIDCIACMCVSIMVTVVFVQEVSSLRCKYGVLHGMHHMCLYIVKENFSRRFHVTNKRRNESRVTCATTAAYRTECCMNDYIRCK